MKELIESIEDYIRKPYTDYAVMINGEWGSGKTHFWNNKLRQRLENIKNKEGKLYKSIYISLYGINSLEEISKKIFLETNPMMTKTLKKFVDNADGNVIPEYVKTGIDIANLYGAMNTTPNQMDFSKLFTTNDKILCFDDLERANIDIIDILGYINNFVEHDGIKTILICNEKELAIKFKNTNIELKTLIATELLKEEGALQKTDDSEPLVTKLDAKIKSVFDRTNAYERIKEKLIGECFEYMPEYSYILNGMIMKYEYNVNLERFLNVEISTIISTFKKTNTRNLRVLKHALNDFEKIFDMVKQNYPETSDASLRTLLMFTIAISFEIKIGSEVKQIFENINSNEEYKSIIYTSNMINDQAGYYLREFDTRYFLNEKEDYRFFKFIEIYVRKRIFDNKVFNQNMKEMSTANIKAKRDPEYTKLLNGSYWKLQDFDFTVLVEQVLYDIKEGIVPSKEYIKLFAVYKHLVEIGVIKSDLEDIHTKFLVGFKASLTAESKLNPNIKETYENFDTTDSVIRDYANECNRLKVSVYDGCIRERVSALFMSMAENIDEFYKELLSEFANIPVFEKYDMDVLYSKLEALPNSDLYNIISLLPTRYENNKELLNLDSANLKRLATVIEEKMQAGDMTIKKALLNNLRTAIIKLT